MEFVRRAANPWGQEVLIGIAWDVMWLAIIASAAFVVVHALLSAARAKGAGEAPPPAPAGTPARVERHSAGARFFHWSMSLAMFALLVTAFVPVLGWEFAWIEIHWIAGVLLVATLVYHVIHVLGWQDFWAIWVRGGEVREGMGELRHAMGLGGSPAGKSGKYPFDHKLFHHLAALASVVAVVTGLLMMVRIDTPLWGRNPYLLSDSTWGVVYLLHGLSGVALIGLVVAHVYFAIRPEKRWITWSMFRGWISGDRYAAHFDPERWPARETDGPKAGSAPGGTGAMADAAPSAPRTEG